MALSACSIGSIFERPAPEPPEPELAPGRIFLRGRPPDPKLRQAVLAGGHPAPPEMPITLQVVLNIPHRQEFYRRLNASEDPNSPLFKKRPSDDEMRSYARPASDYEAVERWLTSSGVRVVSAERWPVYPIVAEGTAAQVEAALNVRIDQSADGKWFANTSDPQIPAGLYGIIAELQGLSNLDRYGFGTYAHRPPAPWW